MVDAAAPIATPKKVRREFPMGPLFADRPKPTCGLFRRRLELYSSLRCETAESTEIV